MKGNDMVRAARGIVAVLVTTVAAAGCSGGKATPAEPTVPTAVSTSSTTAPIDVSVIPPTIDEPYLNAVLAALDEVDSEATRMIVAAKNLTPPAAEYLNAIYSDEAMRREADGWFESLADDPQLSGIRPNPGKRRTVVDRVIVASPGCVWMAVRRDYSARNVKAVPDRLEYIALRPLDSSNDPRKINPTAWMITTDGFRADGLEPSNPCPAS
ncbi:MAG TPA: hypothetical protein VM242_12275 [Acidimicrobiales bacterium]|jgi:hypothetical protein|nr:hypothetical protein [Acidimicrobiales bacterium]